MISKRLLLAALLGLALGSCDGASPFAIEGLEPYTPPATFRQRWAEVEECSGRRGDFDRVKWFQVRDEHYFDYRGQRISGYWWPGHKIVIAGGFLSSPSIVRHEMLHDLLGTGSHPAEYFAAACGGLVTAPVTWD